MNDTDSLLLAYVDGELEIAAVQAAERLIAVDARARRKVEMFRETASVLRAACSESFYLDGKGVLPLMAGPSRRAQRRYGWALAASIAAGVLTGMSGSAMWVGLPRSAHALLIDEIADYHPLYSRESKHLVEIPADHVDDLTTWLEMSGERHLTAPDLTAAGLQFAGGRMLVANGRPVAQLMYTRERGLPVGVCLTRVHGKPASVSIDTRGALRLASWEDDAYAYVIVGELDEAVARDLVGRVRAQLNS
jgi:anti-sigma factor RsiW